MWANDDDCDAATVMVAVLARAPAVVVIGRDGKAHKEPGRRDSTKVAPRIVFIQKPTRIGAAPTCSE